MREEERVASVFELARMCDAYDSTCFGCPINKGLVCPQDIGEKENEAILKWCDEHPIRTYAKDFLEKFPNAERSLRDVPYGICRYRVYNGGKNRPCGTLGCFDCDACWNETMKEEKPNAEQ